METLVFKSRINAAKQLVWEKLWSDEGYRKWTAVFSEGSYAESEWQEGSKIRFLSPDGSGMYGLISRKVEEELMVFVHQGALKNGKEEPKEWAGATESYFLRSVDEGTELIVELGVNADFSNYFNTTFPKALNMLKEICEHPDTAAGDI